MSFEELDILEAKELIEGYPHEQMTTYICKEAINIRLGAEKLAAQARSIVERDIQQGEAFFFINKSHNHYKIIYRDDFGVSMIEKKKLSGKFKLPPAETMALQDLIYYLDGDALLH